ncbi:MAG TPA: MBL fold metallo-hydrolase [Anaerolineae bacterium]|nr:MBL fold metallo-hydrolase [Anaerolineae bacterium]
MESDSFSVKFRGVRGGYPMPGPSTNRVGGNTTCLEVRVGGHLIIIDAGTGIISLGREMIAQYRIDRVPIVTTILFTHTHHDHIQGFPFFGPARLADSTFYIFGPKMLYEDLEATLAKAMLPPYFPLDMEELASMRYVRNLREREMLALSHDWAEPRVFNAYRDKPELPAEAVKVWLMRSYAHPQGGVFVYRVEWRDKEFVFATDTEGYYDWDKRLTRFARGADLLIHDAEYTEEEYLDPVEPKQGWGHSTWQMAVKVAKAAEVKQLALFHHNALHDDDFLEAVEKEAQAVFPPTILAREGLTIEL